MVHAYWQIGREITEEELRGKGRAEYGKHLVQQLSKRLTSEYGKGFDKNNLWRMKAFTMLIQLLTQCVNN